MDVHPTKNGINKYWSIPIWKNKTCSKPPTRIDLLCNFSRSDVSLIKDQVNAKTDANPLSIRLALAASSGSGGEVTLCRSSLTSTWKVMENAHLIPSRLSQSRKLWAKNVVNHSCQGNGTRKLKLEGFEIHPSWNMIDKTHKTQLQHMCHFHIGTTYWAHTHTHLATEMLQTISNRISNRWLTRFLAWDILHTFAKGWLFAEHRQFSCLTLLPCPGYSLSWPKTHNRFWAINQD